MSDIMQLIELKFVYEFHDAHKDPMDGSDQDTKSIATTRVPPNF